MNLLQKITKTQLILLFMTLCFLTSLLLLHQKASSTAPGTDYTISVTQRSGPSATVQPSGPLDLNTASAEQLQTLPGIGPAIAQRIIDYREENGLFHDIEDLLEIPGIGEAVLDKFRPLVTVSRP